MVMLLQLYHVYILYHVWYFCRQLSQVMRELERPVILIDDVLEEDKLFTILSYRESAYMRITPILLNTQRDSASTQLDNGLLNRVCLNIIPWLCNKRQYE